MEKGSRRNIRPPAGGRGHRFLHNRPQANTAGIRRPRANLRQNSVRHHVQGNGQGNLPVEARISPQTASRFRQAHHRRGRATFPEARRRRRYLPGRRHSRSGKGMAPTGALPRLPPMRLPADAERGTGRHRRPQTRLLHPLPISPLDRGLAQPAPSLPTLQRTRQPQSRTMPPGVIAQRSPPPTAVYRNRLPREANARDRARLPSPNTSARKCPISFN